MKISIIASILLLTSVSYAAPSALEVAAAILGDSQMEEATNISEIKYTIRTNGTDRHTEHDLKFNYRDQSYVCESYKLTTTPVNAGRHFVQAEISDCKSASGKKLILNNDYTDESGKTVFRRVFFRENKKFRKLMESEEKIVKSRDLEQFRSPASSRSSGVKVLNTNDLEDGVVLIDSTGEVFGIN